MLEHGKKYWMVTPDGKNIVSRTSIQMNGWTACRYKGRYHAIRGGIRGPMYISSIKGGRC
jgi:hypothetical protein